MTDTGKSGFSNWIFNSFEVTPEGLGLYRIFVALFILCFLLPSTPMYEFIGTLPSDFFHPPPGPMSMFNAFPNTGLLYFLHGLLILSLLGLLVGYKTGVMSITSGLLLLVIKGFFYSVGKINHEMLLVSILLLMSFSGWGAAMSIDARLDSSKKRPISSWPLTLLALIIGFMMFTAGFTKLIGGWLDTDTQAALGHYFNQFFVKGRSDLLAPYLISVDNRMIWEVLDYITILFEIGFLVAIVRPYTTRIFICFAVLFHFSTMMMLNISFLHNFPAYAAFINWSLLYDRLRPLTRARIGPALWVGGGVLLIWVAVLIGGKYRLPVFESDLTAADLYLLLLALPVALFFLSRALLSAFGRIRKRRR